MSAPAIKSSLSGVGASIQAPPAASHSILPMNMMAQKVVPANSISSEANPMKPLSGSGLSYVTLQPASQPLSLVQEHRPTFQPPPAIRLPEKDKDQSEPETPVPNGVETPPAKQPVASDDGDSSKKQNESNQSQNNNLSPENLTQLQPVAPDAVPETEVAAKDSPAAPALHTSASNKDDEKKTTLNNGSKEHEAVAANNVVPPSKTHTEETENKQRSSGASASVQSAKPPADVAASSNTSPKSDIKVATPPRGSKRKSRELKDLKGSVVVSDANGKPKRNRIRTQPYQSPLPDIALIVKTLTKAPTPKANDDKLIVFYKNEFLAVRNAEGSFYVCQAMQNIYKSSRRIRIRWLSQDKNNGEIYSPDFYDYTDFDCILTNLNLNKIDKNKYQLTKIELLRTENILKRAIDVEAGVSEKPRVTEEHPDGLDLSLYKDESQLQKRRKGSKQKQRKKYKTASSDSEESSDDDDDADDKTLSVKQGKTKKRAPGKTAVIAKSIGKGASSSRAERAAIRGSKTATPTTTVAAAASDASKKSIDAKKTDVRKVIAKQQSNFSTALLKTSKPRGTVQNAAENSASTAGRPKRTAANSGTAIVSTGEAAPRKMPRSRA